VRKLSHESDHGVIQVEKSLWVLVRLAKTGMSAGDLQKGLVSCGILDVYRANSFDQNFPVA